MGQKVSSEKKIFVLNKIKMQHNKMCVMQLKMVLPGKFILNVYIRKKEGSLITNLSFHLHKLENKEQNTSNTRRCGNIKDKGRNN